MKKKLLKIQIESEIRMKIVLFQQLLDAIGQRELARTIAAKLEEENAMLARTVIGALQAMDDGLPNIAHSQLKYAQAKLHGWSE